jgi:phosphohistidine phosphatase SixA
VRYLTIVRHCESSPATHGGSDFERELSKRGRKQCKQLRGWALDANELGRFGPTVALVSSAVRTRETFRRAFDETPFAGVREFSELIYNGRREVTAEDLLINLASIDPVTTSLLVVAHNPSVYELLLSLVSDLPKGLRKKGYPLGGAFVLALPDHQQIGLARYELVASYVPD